MRKRSVKLCLISILLLVLSVAVIIENPVIAGVQTQITLKANAKTVVTVINGSKVVLDGEITGTGVTNPRAVFNGTIVTIWYKPSTAGEFANLTSVKTPFNDNRYNYEWTPASAVTFQLKANWTGATRDSTQYDPAESSIVTVTVKLPSAITFHANATYVPLGASVLLSGNITTLPPNTSMKFPNVDVIIQYLPEGAATWTNLTTVQTNPQSKYTHAWTTTAAGTFDVRAVWNGNATYWWNASVAAIATVAFVESPTPKIYVNNPKTGSGVENGNFIFYTNTTFVGDRFNATVWVKNVTDLCSYQVDLKANDTVLNITRAWLPLWDPKWVFTGKLTERVTPSLFDKDFNGFIEEVWVGDLLKLGQTAFNGKGILAIIEFKVLLKPTVGNVSSTLGINSIDTYILESHAYTIWSNKTDGYYELNYAKPASQISINVNPATVNVGQVVTISGRIDTIPANASMTFRNVQVKIWHRAGTSGAFTNIANATANSTSGYSYPWTSVGAGIHQFQTSWAGNATYTGAWSVVQNVTVNKLMSNITLNASPSSVQVGAEVTLNGTLTTGTARVGATVTISYRRSGETTFTFLINKTTGSGGAYSHVWKPSETGTFELKASWAGDAAYASAEDTATVEVTAAPSDWLYYIIAAIVIIVIVAVIAFYFLRKRTKTK